MELKRLDLVTPIIGLNTILETLLQTVSIGSVVMLVENVYSTGSIY